MMVEDVREILNTPFEEVAASSLSLKLLRCYSMLFLGGQQPRTCTRSQRQYYQQLTKNGITMAQQFDAAKNRKCRPAWKGLKYIPPTARHWNSELVTDEEALMLLEKGYVKPSEFLVLPDQPEPEFNEEEQACIQEFSAQLKEGASKKSLREKYKAVKEIGGKKVTQSYLNELINAAAAL